MSNVATYTNCTKTEHSHCDTVTVYEEAGIAIRKIHTAEGYRVKLQPLSEYDAQRQRERAAGITWPHEIIKNNRTATVTTHTAAR